MVLLNTVDLVKREFIPSRRDEHIWVYLEKKNVLNISDFCLSLETYVKLTFTPCLVGIGHLLRIVLILFTLGKKVTYGKGPLCVGTRCLEKGCRDVFSKGCCSSFLWLLSLKHLVTII